MPRREGDRVISRRVSRCHTATSDRPADATPAFTGGDDQDVGRHLTASTTVKTTPDLGFGPAEA
jgi:hypothetical protein